MKKKMLLGLTLACAVTAFAGCSQSTTKDEDTAIKQDKQETTKEDKSSKAYQKKEVQMKETKKVWYLHASEDSVDVLRLRIKDTELHGIIQYGTISNAMGYESPLNAIMPHAELLDEKREKGQDHVKMYVNDSIYVEGDLSSDTLTYHYYPNDDKTKEMKTAVFTRASDAEISKKKTELHEKELKVRIKEGAKVKPASSIEKSKAKEAIKIVKEYGLATNEVEVKNPQYKVAYLEDNNIVVEVYEVIDGVHVTSNWCTVDEYGIAQEEFAVQDMYLEFKDK